MDPRANVPSFRTIAVWLVSTTLMAGAGMTFAGQIGIRPAGVEGEVVASPTPCPTETPLAQPTESPLPGPSPTEDGTAGSATEEPCPSPTAEPTPDAEAVSPEAQREADCREAAGLAVGGEGPEGDEPPGLDHSTEVLLRNCVKNPQAEGLLNALRRHAENRARLAEKRAAKAAKAAERAERRAEDKPGKAGGSDAKSGAGSGDGSEDGSDASAGDPGPHSGGGKGGKGGKGKA